MDLPLLFSIAQGDAVAVGDIRRWRQQRTHQTGVLVAFDDGVELSQLGRREGGETGGVPLVGRQALRKRWAGFFRLGRDLGRHGAEAVGSVAADKCIEHRHLIGSQTSEAGGDAFRWFDRHREAEFAGRRHRRGGARQSQASGEANPRVFHEGKLAHETGRLTPIRLGSRFSPTAVQFTCTL